MIVSKTTIWGAAEKGDKAVRSPEYIDGKSLLWHENQKSRESRSRGAEGLKRKATHDAGIGKRKIQVWDKV